MNISKQARVLAAALAIGVSILSLSAGQVEAKPKKPVKDVYCTTTDADGTINFHLPGTQVWDPITGKSKTCLKDGTWLREGATEGPMAPRPDGGGVYAP